MVPLMLCLSLRVIVKLLTLVTPRRQQNLKLGTYLEKTSLKKLLLVKVSMTQLSLS